MRVFIACVLLSVAAFIDSGRSMFLVNYLVFYCIVCIDATCDIIRPKDFCSFISLVTKRCFEKIRQSPALKLRFIVSVCANYFTLLYCP